MGKHHGFARTPTYYCWENMKRRCYDKQNSSYPHYGGKNPPITVCDKWLKGCEFFVADMGIKPEGAVLDRIDNSKGYYKENCRWATSEQSSQNRTSVVLTIEQVLEINKILAENKRRFSGSYKYGLLADIASKYKVGRGVVQGIANGNTWANIQYTSEEA